PETSQPTSGGISAGPAFSQQTPEQTFPQAPLESQSQFPSETQQGFSSATPFHKESDTYFETPSVTPNEVSSSQIPSPENLSFSPYQEPPMPPSGSSQEFISPEFSPQMPKKSKLLLPLLLAGLLVAVGIVGYFVIWPKFVKKTTQLASVTTTTVIQTTTTTTTTLPPSPFVEISSPYEKTVFEIKIIGEIIASSIIKEATSNMSASGTFKVLIPSVKGSLTTEEVVLSLIPNLPKEIKEIVIKGKYLLYAYYGEVNPSLGLILEVGKENQEVVEKAFLNWEKGKIISDLSKFVLTEMPKKVTCKFQQKDSLGATIRFCDFKTKEKGIGYAFFDSYLIISSSLESLQSAINHLQGPREAIYPFSK
ncbi:MAG: hypothetical protein AB7D02_02460, partial [Candidatus Paceibacterota bacterium]